MEPLSVRITSLFCLPFELIEEILQTGDLNIRDILNFATTCKKSHSIIHGSQRIWRCKFFQRWPDLKNCYSEENILWENEFKMRLDMGMKIRELLGEMILRFYNFDQLSDVSLEPFDDLILRYEHGCHYIMSELRSILQDESYTNLSLKYYADIVFCYMHHKNLRKVWRSLMSQPEDNRILERGALLVAQWLKPRNMQTYDALCDIIESIVTDVKLHLKLTNSNHPVLEASDEQLHLWKSKNILINHWKPSDSKQILESMREVFFIEKGFTGSCDIYYDKDSVYINKVFQNRKGTPILVGIVYAAIARRLGVKLDQLILPSHTLLRWVSTWNMSGPEEKTEVLYIDTVNKGKFVSKEDCPRLNSGAECPFQMRRSLDTSFEEIVTYLAKAADLNTRQQYKGRNSKIRKSLELMHLISPKNMNCAMALTKFYLLHDIDVEPLMIDLGNVYPTLDPPLQEQARVILQLIEEQSYSDDTHPGNQKEMLPKERTSNLKYAVGMVLKVLHNDSKGVVVAWDTSVLSSDFGEDTEIENDAGALTDPFYYLLMTDGTLRYIPQGALDICHPPVMIKHTVIGRYFDSLSSLHYVPNIAQEAAFPKDSQVRVALLASFPQR